MVCLEKRAQRHAAALALVVCLAVGCAHARRISNKVPSPALTSEPSVVLLNADQERRAQALAEYGTGVSMEITGDLDGALEHYRQSLQLDDQNTALAIRLAQIYVSRKDSTNAVAVLERANQANPTSPEPSFWLGVLHKMNDQPDKAIPFFQQTLKLEPTHMGAIQALLEIYLQQNALTDAAKTFDQAWRQNSTDPTYWTRLGDVYALALKQKSALAQYIDRGRVQQCYEKALKLAPDDSDVVLRLADVYADSGEFQKAADAYAKLLEKSPDARQIRERLALNYVRAEQKEKAIAVLEEIIKREPLRFEIYNYLGELYEDVDKDERAISNYQQSLVINPNQLAPTLRLALVQLKLKQYDAVRTTLDNAKERFPTSHLVPYYFGLLYSETKDYPRAVTAFADTESLALESPDEVKLDSSFYFYYGSACERAGDFDKAATLFRKSIELDPDKHQTYNYLGYMWADKGIHLDEALDLIKKALSFEPDNSAYLDSLGWVLYKLGRYEEAIIPLRRAVITIDKDPVVLEHLADVLIKLGKTDEARTYLQRAHDLQPDNKEIAEKLQKLSGDQSAAH